MARLTESTKAEIISFLRDCRMSSMFGDGLEDDYIMNGCSIVGLNEMSDEDLVEEMLCHTGDDEELVIQAQAELAVEEMLESDLNNNHKENV